jgi:hypothetical protein
LQSQHGDYALFHDVLTPSQCEWGKALGAMEAEMALKKDLNQILFNLHALISAHVDPQFP